MVAGLFIICGMGHVGRQIALLLRRLGAEVAVITQSPRDDWLREVRELGIHIELGDGRDGQLLRHLGIDRARALLATTSSDAVNIEIALDARRLRPDLPVVLRIFDQTLARSLERAELFGFRRALGVSSLAAPTLAAAILGRDIQASFVLRGRPLVLGRPRRPLPPSSGAVLATDPAGDSALVLTGREGWLDATSDGPRAAQHESGLRRLWRRLGRARVVIDMWRDSPQALRTVLGLLWLLIAASVLMFGFGMHLSLVDALYFIVATVTTTGYGDITPKDPGLRLYSCLLMLLGSAATALLYSLVTDFVVHERFRKTLGQHRVPQEGHVIVIGLGNVGFRVVEELRRHGVQVVAVSRTDDSEFFAAMRQTGPALVGDGRMPDTLLRAGIAGALGLVAATDDDATNLAIALEARRLRQELHGTEEFPTVVRLLDAEFAAKVRSGLGLASAFSTAALAAPTFVAAALNEGVQAGIQAGDVLLSLCERAADPAWDQMSAAQVAATAGVLPVLRLRGDTPEYLGPAAQIRRGDLLVVLVRRDLR